MGLQDMSLPRFPLLKDEETQQLLERSRQGDQEGGDSNHLLLLPCFPGCRKRQGRG
jgi:hypothetical protein